MGGGRGGDFRRDNAYSDLLDEHRQVRDLVAELAELSDYLKLFPLLEQLDALVASHFEREEAEGGFYQALEQAGTAYAEDLLILRNEHFLIHAALQGLLARARFLGEERMTELLGVLGGLAESLRRHEDREHLLARRLFGS